MTIIGRFNRFVKNIRPTNNHIDEANRQTDYMVENLKGKVAANGTFKLEKVLKAGSNAKFTSCVEQQTTYLMLTLLLTIPAPEQRQRS
jgi:hypothetical protein